MKHVFFRPKEKEQETLIMALKASAWMWHESHMLLTKASHMTKTDKLAHGGIFLPQEVIAVSMVMGKMNNYPKGKRKEIIESRNAIHQNDHEEVL